MAVSELTAKDFTIMWGVAGASAPEIAAGTAATVEADAALGLGLLAAPELVVGAAFLIGVGVLASAVISASQGQQGWVQDPGEYYDPGTTQSRSWTARTQTRTTTHSPTVTVSITNGIRTTTQTTWATKYTTRTTTYSNGSTTTQSATSRIVTAQQAFSEPVINANRPGWTLTQTAPTTGGVTTPNRALSTDAGDCGIGGSIASCQTPSRGAVQCAGLDATAQLCQPAEPAPGSPGGVQANLPHQHTGTTQGNTSTTTSESAAPPELATGGGGAAMPPTTPPGNSNCEQDNPDSSGSDATNNGQYRGGRHGDLRGGNGIERHHMPANATSPLELANGPAIQMDKLDHYRTASWGRSGDAQAYREAQSGLISQGCFDDAVQMDIDDVTGKYPGKYDQAILEMIDYLGGLS